MKRKAKSVISLLLCLVMVLQFMPALGAEEAAEVIVNYTFNDIETNQIEIPGLTISGGRAQVVVTDSSNKALQLKNNINETSVLAQGPLVEEGMDAVYSIDIKADNLPVNLSFGTANMVTASSSTDGVLFKVVNNKIYTSEGKNFGYIAENDFTTVTAVVKRMVVCDYYINGKKVLSNWELANANIGEFVAIRQKSGNSCYVDNIRAYLGNRIKNLPIAPYLDKVVDILTMPNVDGDVCFFDNRYCYTSGAPRYLRYTASPKNGEIITTRLIDYQSPDRTDYIYMKRNDNETDTFFQITLSMPAISQEPDYKHRNLKVEGDFMAPTLQDINFMIRDDKTTGSSLDTFININPDGTISGGGKTSSVVVSQGKWFHFLWALNLDTMAFDVYVDGKKVISDGAIRAGTQQFNLARINLNYSSVIGDLYLDNFEITGLKKPIVDGVETKTGVLPGDENIIEFLEGKVAMHGYGNLIHKNGVKTELKSKGIYDAVAEQHYVPADTLSYAFDLNLTEENGEIGGDVTVKKDGTVTTKDGKTFKLEYTPKVENGRMYVPIRQFASDAVGKHVWFFKTGLMIFSDYEMNIDTSDFTYMSETESERWTPVHHLNAYMEYIRPDVERLKQDYIAKTGDTTFTQHPRIIHNAEEFAKFKQVYDDRSDPVLCQYFDNVIKAADSMDINDISQFANYTQWNDSMRHGMGSRFADLFVRLGYAYWMTGDQKYVDLAFRQFEILDKEIPDLNTAHVIDAGQAIRGIGIGYDWFYNAFTPEQRDYALKVVREKCVERVGNLVYGRVTSQSQGAVEWRSIIIKNNYNAIVNAGITIAALATLEYDPDDHFGYIRESLKSIEKSVQQFAPGGAWIEGASYLNFTMQNFVPWACAMDQAFGTTYNIMEGQGMDGILDFAVAVCGPAGSNQTGDGATVKDYSYNFFYYLSQYFDNPIGSYMRYSDMASGAASCTAQDVFAYDFDAKNIDASIMNEMSKMQRVNGMELISFRDTYEKEDCGMYFSAHFGASSGYHQHWDCGTFVLDFDGQRWAHDLGNDSYLLQNELGYPGYAIFRTRVEAHNILVLNPSAYDKEFEIARNNYAPIVDAQSNQYGGFVYADMSEIYAESPDMKLGYYLDDNMSSVTARYEYYLPEAVEGVWGFITTGVPEIDGNTVFIANGGKSIKLEALTNAKNVRWYDNGNPKPMPTSPQVPEQNKNDGYRQLQLKFDGVQGDNKLVIKITQLGKPAKPIADIPISEWKLPKETKFEDVPNTNFDVLFKGVPVTSVLPVYDGVMPEIEVVPEDPTSIVEIQYAKNFNEKTKIRVYDKDRTTYQLGLVEYYEAKGVSMDGFNTLQIGNVEVTSQPEAENVKENMLDGDLLTRWTTMARGEYALFDLGSIQEVDGIGAAFFKGDQRIYYFNVFVSEDGQNFTQVIKNGETSGATADIEVFKFDKRQKARFIKLEGQGNNGGAPSDVNFNVNEFTAVKSKY